jgi:hypothetical protein
MTPRVRGFWIGAAVAVATIADWFIAGITDVYTPYSEPPWWVKVLQWLTIPILVTGYVTAIALTVRRSTRHLGQGMLLGITICLPVATLPVLAILMSGGINGGG